MRKVWCRPASQPAPTAGTIVVTATSSPFIATATLSSHLAGPDLTSSSFTNAASGSAGMTPCGLVTVSGTGVAPAVQGVVSGVSFFGSLPTTLAGLSISVQQGANNIPVPIQAVANDQSGQQANFQAPCELTPGTATVVVTVNGVSSNPVSVPVFAVQPGIFTSPGSNGKQYGAVIRAVDGTYVTPSNPAQRGERCYMVVTGLGQVTPAATTNSAGTGAAQNMNVPMLVFLNGNAVAAAFRPLSVRIGRRLRRRIPDSVGCSHRARSKSAGGWVDQQWERFRGRQYGAPAGCDRSAVNQRGAPVL